MLDPKVKNHIVSGLSVKITFGENPDGNLISGKVKKVISERDYDPDGILVVLDNGIIGHIKELENDGTPVIQQIIQEKEGHNLEFKSSFKYDMKSSTPKNPIKNDILEKIIAISVAAFANADGGRLIIGVDDGNVVLGLEGDYKLQKNGNNSDRFKIELWQCLEKYFQNKLIHDIVTINIHKINDKEICEIKVKSSLQPIFINYEVNCIIDKKSITKKIQDCYVRVDNSKKLYNYDEFLDYWMRKNKEK